MMKSNTCLVPGAKNAIMYKTGTALTLKKPNRYTSYYRL